MLNAFLFKKIEEKDIANIWFQQEDAACHTAETARDLSRPFFEDRLISHSAVVVRPPRSYDSTSLDYYLLKISVNPTETRDN